MGSLFAGRIAASGAPCVLIARPDHARAIRSSGLEIEGVRPARVELPVSESLAGIPPPDGVLVAVKSFDLVEGGRSVRAAFGSPCPVLLPQNGLAPEKAFAPDHGPGDTADRLPLVRAVNSVPATLLGPGRVRQAGEGEVLLAKDPPEVLRGPTTVFRDALRRAGFPVHEVDDLPREVWRKALVNAAVNPVTADHGLLNGRLAEDPWRGQALALLHEARRAAAFAGFEFTETEAEAELFKVVRATAGNRSSMLQDLERGRPTEIDAISGEILAVAAAHGVDLPATRRAIDRTRAHVAQKDRQRTPQPS